MAGRTEAFLAMLARGQDSALLRFSLGNEYLAAGEPATAAEHLSEAVRLDPDYSAAWKLLGRALAEDGRSTDAIQTYEKGIAIATKNGDHQAAKEMRVFAKRLLKSAPP